WFNYDLLGEVNFWRDYLGQSRSRIIASVGSAGQTLVLSTTLLSSQVEWPGIPAQYDKPFKNVEYLDDRSAWAELPEELLEALDEAGDGEDGGGEEDDEAGQELE